MHRRRDVGIDFTKKKITNTNMLKQLVKYIKAQKFLGSDVKSLIYQDNGLTDICAFNLFSNLQVIDLSNNKIESIPKNLTTIQQLKSLNLAQNRINSGMEVLSKLPLLTFLDLSNNNIKEFDFGNISQLTSLEVLKLTNNEIHTFDYGSLKPLKSLKEFYINTNYIEAPVFTETTICLLFPSPFFQLTPNQIDERLYLGSLDSTRNRDILIERNITGILSLGVKAIVVSKKIQVEYIDIGDLASEAIDQYFAKCFSFMETIIEGGGSILIHCHAGISRSSTVLIAYLMYKKMWRYKEAVTFVKKKRPIISPNTGFEKQLLSFEHKLFNNGEVDNDGQESEE
ncbi:leucine rich repeat and phosphatase domain containing protein [Entamoeba histolytica HM-1:IMSS-B]|uniref:protein-tyrosine-phosphatase n=6 Tax=Entamoeba histolytica TaxID=5759 RepID=C4M7F9_ENTH1|nr:leucine rich repeat and phosphatase domain containing protein [Entamoeba histolytica HM-1:IMSS]EMD48443.1 leucine rich repeat and phosphatase domain containing protein [Entamoeba histolytica KU27]EMH76109.1 leucine rich repeat and phosphatase domain containing protein [Entamoeba histolytica HM-1:IMSS-B]EMS16552.1 leucine rich repeat and phosphatase domain containing protein [Entamoeba histolytica HM-3:IMSS]ENY63712.1 leucine rich repeat and phosphatase domain containing protein [Entamoeba hi|eukprot:XP_648930.1 leucine rich repeat and phosphatase domain containing protein [Entamoeba histolytica HM-1:IMSS]